MNVFQCYTRQQLRDFMLGNLDENVLEQITQHLEECSVCEDTVVGLDQSRDTLVTYLCGGDGNQGNSEAAPDDDSFSHDPHYQAAIHQIIGDADNLAQLSHLISRSRDTSQPQQIGDYEITETLARGGMGSVFKARHTRLEKMVAIKVLPERKMRNSDSIARFAREMKIIGQMSHPSMVAATDAGEDNGTHYLVMELVDGMDLGRIVRNCGPLRSADACELVRQAAIGLNYAHEQNVIHRDVKPSNLMLGRDKTVKVLDLGLATLSGMNGTVDELTTVGQMMGTLDYMAPEQAGSDYPVDQRSDVYGLAATLYKLLTATAPYSHPNHSTPLKKLTAMAISEPIPIRNRNQDIPQDLAELIDACLARDPDLRIQSAAEFAEQLAPFCQGHSLSELLQRAETIAESKVKLAEDGLENIIHSAVINGRPKQKALPKPPAPRSNSGRGWIGNFVRVAAGFAAFGAFAWAGIIIYLNTQSGQLIIESEIDGIKVSILQNENPAKDLQIEHGANSTKLYAGKYQVEINGPSDGLVVSNGVFELRRGQTVVTRITQKKGSEKPTVMPGPRNLALDGPNAQVVVLKHRSCQDVAEIINNQFANHPLKPHIEVVPELGGLAISGHSFVDEAVAMAKQLDQPATPVEPNKPTLRSYKIVGDINLALRVLQTMLEGREGVRMDADPGTNLVMIMADQPVHDLVKEIVQKINGQSDGPNREINAESSATNGAEVLNSVPRSAITKDPARTPTYNGKSLENFVEDYLNLKSQRDGKSGIKSIRILVPQSDPEFVDRLVESTLAASAYELSETRQKYIIELVCELSATPFGPRRLHEYLRNFQRDESLDNLDLRSRTSLWDPVIQKFPNATQDYLLKLLSSEDDRDLTVAILGSARVGRASQKSSSNFTTDARWVPTLVRLLDSRKLAQQPEHQRAIVSVLANGFARDKAAIERLEKIVASDAPVELKTTAAAGLMTNKPGSSGLAPLVRVLIETGRADPPQLLQLVPANQDALTTIEECLANPQWGLAEPETGKSSKAGLDGSDALVAMLSNASSSNRGSALGGAMGGRSGGGGGGAVYGDMLGGFTGSARGGRAKICSRAALIRAIDNRYAENESAQAQLKTLVPLLRQELEQSDETDVLNQTWFALETITGDKMPPLYEGRPIDYWLEELKYNPNDAQTEQSRLQAVAAIKNLAKEIPDKRGLVAAILKNVRDLSFDDLTDEKANKLPILIRDLFTYGGQVVRGGRRINRPSTLRSPFMDLLIDLAEQDVMLALQILKQTKVYSLPGDYRDRVVRFCRSLADSENQLIRQRTYYLWIQANQAYGDSDLNIVTRAMETDESSELTKLAIVEFMALNPGSDGRGRSLPVKGLKHTQDPRVLMTLFKIARDFGKEEQVVDSVLRLLASKPEHLDRVVLPYEVDLWNPDLRVEQQRPASIQRTVFEQLVDFLDALKVSNSGRIQSENLEYYRFNQKLVDEENVWETTKKKAYETLKLRRSQSDDPGLNRKLDRVIERLGESRNRE